MAAPYPFTFPAPGKGAAPTPEAARNAMRRACATLYGVGALTMGISVVTPQPERGPVLALAAVGLACAVVALYLVVAGRVPDLVLLAMPALGSVAISVPMLVERTATGSPFFYLWPGLIAACFLRGREVVATLVWSAACLAAVLAGWVDTPDGDAILFVDAVCAIGITCAVVFVLKQRVLALVDRLHEASRTDPLTGVLNRRAFEEAMVVHAESAERHGTPFVLALMDLDHFKAVNDRLGHAAGDRALVRFTEIVLEEKRHGDVFGRLGGEEFGLLLAATDVPGAHAFADRLRGTIQTVTASDEAGLTVSVGLADYRAGENIEDLLHDADVGLYAAKDNGRNRVVVTAASPARADPFSAAA